MSTSVGVVAFARRDLQVLLTDRRPIAADALRAGSLVLVFALIGEIVDPTLVPVYGGEQTGYAEFAAVGALLSLVFAHVLARAAFTLRREQAGGTLEPLLATPMRRAALQAGPFAFEVLHTPLRLGLYLTVAAMVGLDLELSGVLPALVGVLALLPFVWGAGLATAGALTVATRGYGSGTSTTAALALGLTAGAYVPLDVLPEWLEAALALNPLTITLEAIRAALIGGEGWAALGPVAVLVPVSLITLAAGAAMFRAALARPR